MSRSFKSYQKRDPKRTGIFLGAYFNTWCGFTCCGFRGQSNRPSAKREIRAWRRAQDREAVREGLADRD